MIRTGIENKQETRLTILFAIPRIRYHFRYGSNGARSSTIPP
jgi:hypothetical protein